MELKNTKYDNTFYLHCIFTAIDSGLRYYSSFLILSLVDAVHKLKSFRVRSISHSSQYMCDLKSWDPGSKRNLMWNQNYKS